MCITVVCVQALTSSDTAFGSVVKDFQGASGPKERANLLLKLAEKLPRLPADMRTNVNRVMGCTSQVSQPAPRNAIYLPAICMIVHSWRGLTSGRLDTLCG